MEVYHKIGEVAIDSVGIGCQLAQGAYFTPKQVDILFVILYNNLVQMLTFHTIMVQLSPYDSLFSAGLPTQ